MLAEKPLCDNSDDVWELFDMVKVRNLLQHTAFNRRHDPAIVGGVDRVRSKSLGRVWGVTFV